MTSSIFSKTRLRTGTALAIFLCATLACFSAHAQIAFQRQLTGSNELPTVPAYQQIPTSDTTGTGIQICYPGSGPVPHLSKLVMSQSAVQFTPQGGGSQAYYMYVHGNSTATGAGKVAFVALRSTDGVSWCALNNGNTVIPNSFSFDSSPITNGTAVVYNDPAHPGQQAVFFFFETGATTNEVGVAISPDGVNFTEAGTCSTTGLIALSCPGGTLTPYAVLPPGPGEPFAIVAPSGSAHAGNLYLFVRHQQPDGDNTDVWYSWSSSSDGMNFDAVGDSGWPADHDMFTPSNTSGAFDEYGISGVRLYTEGSYVYLIYGGAPARDASDPNNTGENCTDYPEGLGFARLSDSKFPGDLTTNTWNRYPNNPVLLRSAAGTWADGALWSGSMLKIGNQYMLWYEATGTDAEDGDYSSIGVSQAQVAQNARMYCYGGFGTHTNKAGTITYDKPYSNTSFLQVGVATMQVSGTQNLNSLWNTALPASGTIHSTGCLSMASSTAIENDTCNGTSNQQWTFTQNTDGFYKLSSGLSGGNNVLTSNAFSWITTSIPSFSFPGSVAAWKLCGAATADCSGTESPTQAQEWWIVPSGTSYSFVNRDSSFTLSVPTGSQSGIRQQRKWAAVAAQSWSIVP